MTGRIAADSNAVIAFLRQGRPSSSPLKTAGEVILPLNVVGELFVGAYLSTRHAENVAIVEETIASCTVLPPDTGTARTYGRLRALVDTSDRLSTSRLNDLWIAALCLQHDLPLLTNDRGFDAIPGLVTLHW